MTATDAPPLSNVARVTNAAHVTTVRTEQSGFGAGEEIPETGFAEAPNRR